MSEDNNNNDLYEFYKHKNEFCIQSKQKIKRISAELYEIIVKAMNYSQNGKTTITEHDFLKMQDTLRIYMSKLYKDIDKL